MPAAAGFGVKSRGHGSRMADELPGAGSNNHAYVRIAFNDGYHYRWPLRDGVSAGETLEEIRRAIAGTQWFVIPEAEKSYSPHALVSVEVVTSSDDDDPSAAERLGQTVREHVIDPITEAG
jgi:hypothetical protein